MRKYIVGFLFFITSRGISQPVTDLSSEKQGKGSRKKIGLKIGYNYSSVTGKTASFDATNKNGFMVAGFFAPPSAGVMGFRTELVYSSQGYNYEANGKSETANQQYLYLPQLTTIAITRLLQVQFGGQAGFLLKGSHSQKDSVTAGGGTMTDFYNKMDYGFAAGLEIYPFKGLIVGGRYNISLGNIYKQGFISGPISAGFPPFDPAAFKGRHVTIQFFAGYKF